MTILQIMPLAKALLLAAKKKKRGFNYSARLYQDILNPFPQNTAARKAVNLFKIDPSFGGRFFQEQPSEYYI